VGEQEDHTLPPSLSLLEQVKILDGHNATNLIG
jgi:hypothetical protein